MDNFVITVEMRFATDIDIYTFFRIFIHLSDIYTFFRTHVHFSKVQKGKKNPSCHFATSYRTDVCAFFHTDTQVGM